MLSYRPFSNKLACCFCLLGYALVFSCNNKILFTSSFLSVYLLFKPQGLDYRSVCRKYEVGPPKGPIKLNDLHSSLNSFC